MIAGVFLIPTFEAFISSPRTGGGLFFYPLYYYPKLLASLISTNNTGNWSLIGISSIILVTLPLFLMDKKRNSTLFKFLIVLMIPILIPVVATIFDCMSFPNNRWAYVIPFIFSLITIEVLEKDLKIDIKRSSIIIVCYGIIIYLLRLSISIQEVVALILAFVFLYLLFNKKKYLLPMVVISIICNFYFMYDYHFGGYINEFAERDTTLLYQSNNNKIPYLNDAIEFIKNKDDGFYNIMVYPNILNNLGIVHDYNSTNYFYSIVSKNYFDLANDLNNQETTMNGEIKTFNHRTKINELLNNKYLITTNKDYHPYGYEVLTNYNNETFVLKNKVGSSFAHLYTKTISLDDYESFPPLFKEDALLKYNISNESLNIEYPKVERINFISNKTLDNGEINIYNTTDKLVLNFDNVNNRELYLEIDNLEYQDNAIIKEFGKLGYSIRVCLDNLCFDEWEENKYLNAYYIDNKNVLINLGYYDKLSGNVSITFNSSGKYTFDNLGLYTVSFDDYEKVVNDLNVPLSNMSIENSKLFFDIDIKEDGVLAFTTNYSKYFDIYVDGEKVPSKIVNKYFLGCDITLGTHHIEINYHNTLILKSFYVSILGILSFFGIIVIDKKKKAVRNEKS